jgi:DNA-binding Lrp family transcriptional regulator
MKEKDIEILSHLRENSKQPLAKISEKTGIPKSTIHDRIKENERSVIKKHTILLDYYKMGYFCRANILLKVDHRDKNELQSFLSEHPAVNSLYLVNHKYDFMVDVFFHHMKLSQDFLDDLEQRFSIQNKDVNYILHEIKQEEFLARK